MTSQVRASRFPVGDLVITRNASSQLSEDDIFRGLVRHLLGDWGELCKQVWQRNEAALEEDGPLFSRFLTREGKPYWVITEWDRSVTTILLPGDY